jgi:hypothetical protein
MLARGTRKRKKKSSTVSRIFLLVLTAVLIISGGIWGGSGANAEYVVPINEIPKLQKVGPLHADNKYPVWYKDSRGTKLQLCLEGGNPLCAFALEDLPDPLNPDAPFSLKDGKFPVEAFYQLASSEIDLPSGGRAVAVFALEAAWANEIVQDGDQIVFGRVRFRIDGLQTNGVYTISHPYGVDRFTAEVEDEDDPDVGEIRFVEDIGINGGFEGPKNSRIGTFLEWDEGAPEGYVGDPNIEHKVKNGYNGQNYFRIEGPGLEDVPEINQCKNTDGTVIPDCIQTDLFSLMGKRADNSGVDIARATYSTEAGNPNGTIDVFASTAEGDDEDIVVSGTGISQVQLKGSNGHYFARIHFDATKEPPELTVTNRSDTPDTVKTIKPVDKINASAKYTTEDDILTIHATSSDKIQMPKLTVDGFGDITDGNGILSIPIGINGEAPKYIPATITVKSTLNGQDLGSVTVPVEIMGGSFQPEAISVFAKADSEGVVGEEITLDGSASSGPIQSYLWTKTSGPDVTITDADKAVAKVTIPEPINEPLVFTLTVTGEDGSSASSSVTVNISRPIATPTVAEAGTHQTVNQGIEVTLDGSATSGATEYSWKLLSGPAPVSISGSNTVIAKFISPKKVGTWVFELTAIGPGGQSKDTVEVTTNPGTLSNISAQLRDSEWIVSGQSSVVGPGVTVTVSLGTFKATAMVDTTGAWRYRGSGPIVPNGTLITITSSSGATATTAIRTR